MADDGFRYYLVRTVTGEVLDEVPFTELSYTTALNAPGGYTGSGLPVTHHLAPLVFDDDVPWARSLFVVRGGLVHFGGPITTPTATVSEDGGDGVAVGGQGVLGYYRDGRRTLKGRGGMTYATTHPKGNIAWEAIRADRIIGDAFDHAAYQPGGALPLTVVVDGSTSGFATPTIRHNGYERKGIGELLDDVAAIDPGLSYWTTHHFDTGDDPPTLASVLHLAANAGALRPVPVVLELGRNATAVDYAIDGEAEANDVAAIGQGQGERMLVAEVEAGGRMYPATDVPRLESVLALNDVKDRPTLYSMARNELALRLRAAKVLKLIVVEDDEVALGTFKAGDDVVVEGSWGAIDLGGRWRVLTLGATIDADHNVSLAVDLVPSSAFDPL